MQQIPHDLELQFLENQRNGVTHWSDPVPTARAPTGNAIVSPTIHVRALRTTFLLISIAALLFLFLAIHICLLERGPVKPQASSLRRLAASDEEEECQEFVDERASSSGGRGKGVRRSHREGASRRTSSRKRGGSTPGEDDGAEVAKKPLLNEEDGPTRAPQSGIENGEGSSTPTPSTQPEAAPQEDKSSGGTPRQTQNTERPNNEVAAPAEPKTNSQTQEAGFMAGLDVLEEAFADIQPVEQWFLDFILDPSLTSLPASKIKEPDDEQPPAEKGNAAAAQPQDAATTGHTGGDPHPPPEMPQEMPRQRKSMDSEPTEEVAAEKAPLKPDPPVQHPASDEEAPSSSSTAPSSVQQELVASPNTQRTSEKSSEETKPPQEKKDKAKGVDFESHLFYRLPKAVCSSPLYPFNYKRAKDETAVEYLPRILSPIRELLTKEQLESNELQALITHAEQLVKYTMWSSVSDLGPLTLRHVQQVLGHRFIILDALWCITEVVDPAMRNEEWWTVTVNKLAKAPEYKLTPFEMGGIRHFSVTRMISALKEYQRGNRPAAREVVQLKQVLFCSLIGPLVFRRPEYDGYRQDDF
ncbi:hypothetical protein EBH_0065650 [Eimeria brunetti]|uniref:Uncharacterized protein n=1 Tax=Eimeria brunetti TaxID=51314 RepID=U6LUK1_9EIME|nr:hypothetical protein EBH_0065650 [Eimeria brunetti]